MRIVFLGSGAFGLPTLRRLVQEHQVVLVVSQPDRPAGRHRRLTPTPISAFAHERGIELARPEDARHPELLDAVAAADADALVVIAYGHKLGPELLAGRFAINLHASLLPKYRGAAPINWAVIEGEIETGISVITLADRMDAGLVLGRRGTPIDANETAGELHDRLAEMGPDLVHEVLAAHAGGTLQGEAQDPAAVTWARKLTKEDGCVDFNRPAEEVRRRIHGLVPWPGCTVRLGGGPLRLHRVAVAAASGMEHPVGELDEDGVVGCAPGAVRLLEVQPPGGRIMSFDSYRCGHAR